MYYDSILIIFVDCGPVKFGFEIARCFSMTCAENYKKSVPQRNSISRVRITMGGIAGASFVTRLNMGKSIHATKNHSRNTLVNNELKYVDNEIADNKTDYDIDYMYMPCAN